MTTSPETRPDPWWLWTDRSHPPAWNMAADEALLRTAPRRGRAVLRIYGWDRPAASIGYFQPAAEGDGTGLAWVRRTTGGGIVRHVDDLTYTIALPAGHPVAALDPTRSYRVLNRCVARALGEIGIGGTLSATPLPRHTDLRTMVCFRQPTRYDVLDADGHKVAGAAQRRTRDGILHQGSILPGAIARDLQSLADALPGAVTAELGVAFEPFVPADEFLQLTETLADERYGADAWNRQR